MILLTLLSCSKTAINDEDSPADMAFPEMSGKILTTQEAISLIETEYMEMNTIVKSFDVN